MTVPSPFTYGTGGLPAPAPIGAVQGPALPANQRAMIPGVSGSGVPAPAPVVVGAPTTPPATTPTAAPTLTPLYGAAGVAQGGFAAGAPAAAAYDTKSGVISALSAGASGAASGAIVGSVVPGIGTAVGAAVGGGIGLLTGGLNAYLSVGAQNKTRRKEERLLQEAEAKQAARDKIARDDAISQLAYDRGEAARQKKWAKNLQIRQAIQELTAAAGAARDQFVATGRV